MPLINGSKNYSFSDCNSVIRAKTTFEVSFIFVECGWSVDAVQDGELLAILRLLLQVAAHCQKEARKDDR